MRKLTIWLLNFDLTFSYEIQAGVYSVKWTGTDEQNEPVSSGMYLVKMTTPKNVQTQKVVLLK